MKRMNKRKKRKNRKKRKKKSGRRKRGRGRRGRRRRRGKRGRGGGRRERRRRIGRRRGTTAAAAAGLSRSRTTDCTKWLITNLGTASRKRNTNIHPFVGPAKGGT